MGQIRCDYAISGNPHLDLFLIQLIKAKYDMSTPDCT
jgi:hypothetical protein